MTAEHETFPATPANSVSEMVERHAFGLGRCSRLPAGQRQAIELLKLKEMSLKEAAGTTGLSVAAPKVATHRGLKALRKLLAGRDGAR